jgi:hypothetical protein
VTCPAAFTGAEGGMAHDKDTISEVHTRLGYMKLNRLWARIEILFGLGSAGIGMFLGAWAVSQSGVHLGWVAAAWLLVVLGGYLALAGQRSYLYQSLNEQSALLLDLIRGLKKSESPSEAVFPNESRDRTR